MRRSPWTTAALGALLTLLPVALGAAEEGGDGHGGGNPLSVNIPATIWAILSFAVVLFVIWKKLMPPILTAMDRRAEKIREGLEAAERARAEAETMMKQHQSDLEKARQEARAIIEEGKSDAEKLRQKILDDAKTESEEIAARARREIELAKQGAIDELHKQSVALSLDLAGQLIQKSLDASDHQQLINDRIQNFRP